MKPKPPVTTDPAPAARPDLLPGQVLLVYSPDGALGGTFTCTACRAQAWQPDLLSHAADCPFAANPPAPGDARVTPA